MTGVRAHTIVWLVRPGQTPSNREHRYLSRTDQPLTDFGLARAAALGHLLRRFAISAAITPGLQQDQETAAAILTAQRRPPGSAVDRRWIEGDAGHWEGLTYGEVSRRFGAEAQVRFADPWRHAPAGGETLSAVQARIRAAWHDLLAAQSGGKVLLVAHTTPLQLLLADLLGTAPERPWQLRIDLGSVTAVDLYPSAAILRMLNYLPPLR